jgi:hypothetical protein
MRHLGQTNWKRILLAGIILAGSPAVLAIPNFIQRANSQELTPGSQYYVRPYAANAPELGPRPRYYAAPYARPRIAALRTRPYPLYARPYGGAPNARDYCNVWASQRC